jgi:hypothetical protein
MLCAYGEVWLRCRVGKAQQNPPATGMGSTEVDTVVGKPDGQPTVRDSDAP